MAEKQTYESDIVLEEIVKSPYKYGFKTDIETEEFPKGIKFGIKNPYKKASFTGLITMRNDNP